MPLADMEFNKEEKEFLLSLVSSSIKYGLKNREIMPVDLSSLPESLRPKRSSFVTLKKFGQLRGCCGSLYASKALAEDVVSSAYAAAFLDNRFPSLTIGEFEHLKYYISILSPVEEISFTSEEDLMSKIRPGQDGLFLEEGAHRGSFLPVMWEQLPDPGDFMYHLKIKAGLPGDYWSDKIKISRYTALLIE